MADLVQIMAEIAAALATCEGLTVTAFDPTPNMRTGAAAIVGLPVNAQRIDYLDTNSVVIPVTVKCQGANAQEVLARINLYSFGSESVIDALFKLDDHYQIGELTNFGTFADQPANSNVLGFDVQVTYQG